MTTVKLTVIIYDLTVGALLSPTHGDQIIATLRRICRNVFLSANGRNENDLYRVLTLHGQRHEIQRGLIARLNSLDETERKEASVEVLLKQTPNPPMTLLSSDVGFDEQDRRLSRSKILLGRLPTLVTLATVDPILHLLPGWCSKC